MATKYFPKTSLLEAGTPAPEGTTVKTCESCKKNFAVTSDYADAAICEYCAEAEAKANAVAALKANVVAALKANTANMIK